MLSQPPPGRDDEFNDWYDTDHAPSRVRLPGIPTARRYFDLAERHKYLALYDLMSLAVLDGDAYRTVVAEASDREHELLAASTMDRRVYRRIETPTVSNADDLTICTEIVLCVWWTPPLNGSAELNTWYNEEHIPLLMKVPGWRRIRRYELVTGNGPSFLAVHDLDSPAVLDHPLHRSAIETPWRTRVAAARVEYQRSLFQLRSRFDNL